MSILVFLLLGIFHQASLFIVNYLSSDELYFVLSLPLGLLYGPAILLLIDGLRGDFNLKKSIIHFIPFVFGFLFFLVFGTKRSIFFHFEVEYSLLVHVVTLIHFCCYLSYIGFRDNMKATDYILVVLKKNSYKVYITCVLFAILIIELFVMVELRDRAEIHELFVQTFYLTFFSIVAKLYLISSRFPYAVDGKNAIRLPEQEFGAVIVDCEVEFHRMAKLRKRELLYKRRLERFIEDRVYLDVELNKEKFCKQIGIPMNDLSPFLKKEYGKGFNGFINQLRVNYAAKQLESSKPISTVDDLGFVCGFNSRSSFYRSFQFEFGCTPIQYCKDRIA